MTTPLIAYYRVSTVRQQQSGLGLQDQQNRMEQYARSNDGEIVATYQEAESGKRADRPQLRLAMAHAKSIGAKLVIAKLDRLARNVAFLSALMESGLDFVAIDNPHATRLTTHILAAVAEDEARAISSRTKSGLDSIRRTIARDGFYRARSGRVITGLGSAMEGRWSDEERVERRRIGLEKARKIASTVQKGATSIRMQLPAMREMRSSGLTYQQIADKLNEESATTRLDNRWCKSSVWRALRKCSNA